MPVCEVLSVIFIGFFGQQFQQLFFCQFVAHVVAFYQRVGKVAFGVVQAQYLFLDGMLGNEVVDGHFLLLPDTVGAVGSLLLDGRVPPRIQVNDVVGTGQVQSQSSGFQADKEQRAFSLLKLLGAPTPRMK